MNKKIFLSILLLSNILNAGNCKYYEDKMVFYSNKLDQLIKDTPPDYCNLADNAELMVNNLGGVMTYCSDGYKLEPELKTYKDFLIAVSLKCKK